MYCFFVGSNYLYYGAEGISLAGLQRLLGGDSFISTLNHPPLQLSTYSPLFYVLYYPFAKVLALKETQDLAYLVRTLNLAYLAAYIFLIAKLFGRASKGQFAPRFLVLGACFMIFKEFTVLLSFKPDLHGIGLEIIALLLMIIYLRERSLTWLFGSALLFALAALIKINMVGMGLGVGLALILRGQLRSFGIFAGLGAATLILGGFLLKLHLSDEHFRTLLLTTGSDFAAMTFLPSLLKRLVYSVLFPYALYFYLSRFAIAKSSLWNSDQKAAWLWAGHLAFALGFVGQLKYGADINYFYDYLALDILLAAHGCHLLLRERIKPVWLQRVQVGFVAVVAVLLSFLPAGIVFNDWRHYDYQDLNRFLDDKYPGQNVVTEFNGVATQLGPRAALGPGFFAFVDGTRALREQLPSMLAAIEEKGGIQAVVAARANCQAYRPRAELQALLSRHTHLVYQKGKLCVFASSPI